MSTELPRTVSEPTLKRLPLYHRYLKELLQREQGSVSCTGIGEELKLKLKSFGSIDTFQYRFTGAPQTSPEANGSDEAKSPVTAK